MRCVLDSSVALSWCFEDEVTPATERLLDEVTAEGAMVPSHWSLEVQNVLLVAEWRGRIEPLRRREMIVFLHDLPIESDPLTLERAWNATMLLAEHFRLTVYDAAYLELAQRLAAPLASLDRSLRQAASAVGVPVLGL